MSKTEDRLQRSRETRSELIERESRRDDRIRGWLGCVGAVIPLVSGISLVVLEKTRRR